MTLDQMFVMLRNWGERHTAFGQTAHTQRAERPAAQRDAAAEGRKADSVPVASPGMQAVIHTQLERGVVTPPGLESVPRKAGGSRDRSEAAAKADR